MIVEYIFLGGLFATFVCIFVFLTVFIVRGAKYRDRSEPEYSRLTWGNPLNALFIDRILTTEGIRFRSLLLKTLMATWLIVLVAAVAASYKR
jgi:hypothetical protein